MGCFEMYCTLCDGPLSGCIYTMDNEETEWMKRLVYMEREKNPDEYWTYDSHGRIKNMKTNEIIPIHDCNNFRETTYLPVSLKAVHENCWIVCNEPEKLQINKKNPMKIFQGQVFAAGDFLENNPESNWMFLNPFDNEKNRKRIIDRHMQ
jgi:hypothetical protein